MSDGQERRNWEVAQSFESGPPAEPMSFSVGFTMTLVSLFKSLLLNVQMAKRDDRFRRMKVPILKGKDDDESKSDQIYEDHDGRRVFPYLP